jgi:demethoxyubiquinone hydroxylase (CLK1/Coq7/Cat5 family)
MTAPDQTTDICNTLLTGEISAVKTYTEAMDKCAGSSGDAVLERIRAVHQSNVAELRTLLAEHDAEPAEGTGLWGGFAQALEASDTLMGESPALKMLQAGEELGISQYENALANTDVADAAKELIRRVLLPPLSAHLIELQQRRDRVE